MAKEDLFEEGKQPAAEKPAVNADKLKALRAAMDKIEKNYGKGSIMKLGDESVENIEVIPTGSIALNAALGVGGYPKGRVIEIYGPESSGKTTLAIHAIAEAQKNKGIYVTDGPFPYRCADGTLLLLWSSMGEEGYTEAIAVSDNGDIDGNWVQRDELLFKKDGGHGMIFKTFDDKLLLLLHSPNKHPLERPAYFELEDKNGMLCVK